MEMKSKHDCSFNKIGQVVSLNLMLDNDIRRLHSLLGTDFLNIDRIIHEIRKSLKSVLAILFFYEFQFDQTQYLSFKSNVKCLSKQYALYREHFVYLQTYHKVENELKDIDKNFLIDLRNQIESRHNSIVLENIVGKETIQKGIEAILKIIEAIQNLEVNSELKLLKRRLLKSHQKTQDIYKKLTLNSSSDEFHVFRKWCKRFYFQQAVFNRLGFTRTSKQNKKLYKITEDLGKEHDLNLFNQYLSVHFAELSKLSRSFFYKRIRKLRKSILMVYPKINY